MNGDGTPRHQVVIVGAAASDTAGIPPWGPAAADVVLCLTDERPSAALVGRCRALGAGRIIFIHRPDGFLMQEVNALGQGNNSRLVRLFGGEVAPLVAHFAEHRALSPKDIQRLKALI